MNDSNKEALTSQDKNEKEPVLIEEVDNEEEDPNIVLNDEVQSDPIPTIKVSPLFRKMLNSNIPFKT